MNEVPETNAETTKQVVDTPTGGRASKRTAGPVAIVAALFAIAAIRWWSSHGEAGWLSLMPSFLRKSSTAPSATRKSAAEMLGRPDLSTSATEFFETWQKKGAKEAAAALDRRADAAWTELLDNLSKDHRYEIKEVISATARNEGDYVVKATGERIHVQMVKMDLVVKEDGEFHPDDSWVRPSGKPQRASTRTRLALGLARENAEARAGMYL